MLDSIRRGLLHVRKKLLWKQSLGICCVVIVNSSNWKWKHETQIWISHAHAHIVMLWWSALCVILVPYKTCRTHNPLSHLVSYGCACHASIKWVFLLWQRNNLWCSSLSPSFTPLPKEGICLLKFLHLLRIWHLELSLTVNLQCLVPFRYLLIWSGAFWSNLSSPFNFYSGP